MIILFYTSFVSYVMVLNKLNAFEIILYALPLSDIHCLAHTTLRAGEISN